MHDCTISAIRNLLYSTGFTILQNPMNFSGHTVLHLDIACMPMDVSLSVVSKTMYGLYGIE